VIARGFLVLSALVPLAAAAALAACGLDFDRYDPTAGGADASSDARADVVDAPTGVDAGADASDAHACTPSQACIAQAGTCGAACGQTYQQCVANCGGQGCKQGCLTQEQSCLGQCASTCIGCTQTAGCADSRDCLDASRPGP
jgi:hypothetical protein